MRKPARMLAELFGVRFVCLRLGRGRLEVLLSWRVKAKGCGAPDSRAVFGAYVFLITLHVTQHSFTRHLRITHLQWESLSARLYYVLNRYTGWV